MPTALNIAIPANATSAPLGFVSLGDPSLRWFGGDGGSLFDFASKDCFARQANPLDGDQVINFSNNLTTRNGTISVVGGMTFAGNGLDYSGVTAPGNILSLANPFDAIEAASDTVTASTTNGSTTLTVTAATSMPLYVGSLVVGTGIPAGTRISAYGSGVGGVGTYILSAAATADGTGVSVTVKNKEFVFIAWCKMPSAADWPATSRAIAAAGNYASAADLFTMYMTTNTGSKDLVIRPQSAINTTTAIVVANAGTTFSGKVVQILVWRTAAGVTTVRLKATDGTTQTTTPVTISTNSATLSGLTWRFGTMTSAQTQSNFSAAGSWNATDIGACKWRLYRGMIQSSKILTSYNKTPLDIANDDWTDTVARAAFS